MDLNSRHHTELHCFTEGTIVVEREDIHKVARTVIATSGYYKDDHIKLDEFNSPWMIAGSYVRQT
jgi:hypothetical protein